MDIYQEDFIDEFLDDDCISAEEHAFMQGYLS